MARVRFADLCDQPNCGKRSQEYTPWPVCRECLLDTCDEHDIPGKRDDETNHTLCRACAALEAEG